MWKIKCLEKRYCTAPSAFGEGEGGRGCPSINLLVSHGSFNLKDRYLNLIGFWKKRPV
jgi:hypothetical protein